MQKIIGDSKAKLGELPGAMSIKWMAHLQKTVHKKQLTKAEKDDIISQIQNKWKAEKNEWHENARNR